MYDIIDEDSPRIDREKWEEAKRKSGPAAVGSGGQQYARGESARQEQEKRHANARSRQLGHKGIVGQARGSFVRIVKYK